MNLKSIRNTSLFFSFYFFLSIYDANSQTPAEKMAKEVCNVFQNRADSTWVMKLIAIGQNPKYKKVSFSQLTNAMDSICGEAAVEFRELSGVKEKASQEIVDRMAEEFCSAMETYDENDLMTRLEVLQKVAVIVNNEAYYNVTEKQLKDAMKIKCPEGHKKFENLIKK